MVCWRRSWGLRPLSGASCDSQETARPKLLHNRQLHRRRLPISLRHGRRRYAAVPAILPRAEVKQANFWHNPFYCLARKGRPRGSPFLCAILWHICWLPLRKTIKLCCHYFYIYFVRLLSFLKHSVGKNEQKKFFKVAPQPTQDSGHTPDPLPICRKVPIFVKTAIESCAPIRCRIFCIRAILFSLCFHSCS